MSESTKAVEFAHQNQDRFVDELISLVNIPSISTDPVHHPDVERAASYIAAQMSAVGLKDVQIFPTQGKPVVYGQFSDAGPQAPTVLFYAHYDVQPAEPLDQWHTPPFSAEVKGEYLYGRGASDMKGQLMASLKALEAVTKSGKLPVNVKFIAEGEEEIGSPHLAKFIQEHKDLLKADIALNPDAGMVAADIPTIVYGLRGLAYFELRIYGPAHDLHSGLFGGVVHNPAQVLAELIAGMHDSTGYITLPGFYEHVRELSSEERAELSRLPMSDDYYKNQTGAPELWGETGYSAQERIGARPTLEINGLLSGFTGKGSKTVIPAWAMAKISMRLVPDQDPVEIDHSLRQYLYEHTPGSVRWELDNLSGGKASLTHRDTIGTKALSRALETVWHTRPVFKRDGGSIPVVTDMQNILGVDSVLTGFALPDDNIHAPNEKLHLPTWFRGIDALIYFLNYLAE
jgi:acetylornithine deacetylase/succinyl-diaminopimelate desuccinylase-like protein